ncbi:MAG: AEC family transporter [Clostridia bacterium]
MENIIFSANIVLPLIVIILSGSIAKKVGIIDDKMVSDGNDIIFKLFLPVLIFCNIYKSDFDSLNAFKLFAYVGICIILSFAVSLVIALTCEKENSRRGVMIQGLARTNYAMLGIPLLGLLFEGQDIALGSLLVAIVIPLYNILSIVALTYFGDTNANPKAIALSIVKNPLIIASMIGLSLAFLRIKIPAILYNGLYDLGSIATPFALFLLGATFKMKAVKNILKPLLIVVINRLLIFPGLILMVGVMLGFRDIELGCILITFASPTAATSYTMAIKMNGDGDLASAIVIFTSIFCMFTFFLFILALKTFAYI